MNSNLHNKPTERAIKEAKNNPNGWVYKIDGNYDDDQAIPPEKIVGAWKVNSEGLIEGDFINNPNYQPTSR